MSTWSVGSFPVGGSWCGAQDMAGNVWQWCEDWYGANSATLGNDPTGPVSGKYRVLRRRFVTYIRNDYRGAYRVESRPDEGVFFFGFRCASTAPGP